MVLGYKVENKKELEEGWRRTIQEEVRKERGGDST